MTSSDLSGLTSEALTSRISQLLGEERAILVAFLRHLTELERRKLHLEQGYSSCFVYCTERLRLSNASAYRRTTAARLLAQFPEVTGYLLDGRLCLTTLCLLKDVLTDESASEILERAAGRTEKEVDVLVASLRPRLAMPDLIRALPSRATTQDEPAAASHVPTVTSAPEAAVRQTNQVNLTSPAPQAPRRAAVEAIDERLHVVRMTVGPEFMAELEEVKAALSHQVPPGSTLEILLRRCFRIALDACSRRRGGNPRKHAASEGAGPTNGQKAGKARSRYVPVAIRREVWERDGARCAFVGSSGKRCGSRDRIELHHIVPFADGEEATAACLELRCRAHNLFEAHLDFGDELMDGFRRQSPTAAAAQEHAQTSAS